MILCWTARGLCRAEQTNARGEGKWIADRTATDAETLKLRSDQLDAEQGRAEATDWSPALKRCAEECPTQ